MRHQLQPQPLLRIRAERRRRGMRMLDLAFHANVPMSELSRIETGRTIPYPAYAKRLSDVLDIPAEDLQEEVTA